MTGNRWLRQLEENPEHSQWYIERFRTMAAEGKDLDGEARLVDAMVGRGSRVLDAGCGPGRVGGRLAELGHQVVGVDLDAELIAAAQEDHLGATWLVGDLCELDLSSHSISEFDLIVSAGNVMAFLDPATRVTVLDRLAAHLAPDGRLVVGFGSGRDYEFDDFFADVAAAGLREELRLATWDLRPFTSTSDFLVCVLSG
jgi:SAM-dependent methyltransferase